MDFTFNMLANLKFLMYCVCTFHFIPINRRTSWRKKRKMIMITKS